MTNATQQEIDHATAKGYTHESDTQRGCSFQKLARRVWSVRDGWQTADLIDGRYTNHRKYTDLTEALDRWCDRKQYVNNECTHGEYYRQFVTDSVLRLVQKGIGEEKVKASTDEHFNDIPLQKWDSMDLQIGSLVGQALSDSNKSTGGNGVSLSDTVCVAKAAARLIRGW